MAATTAGLHLVGKLQVEIAHEALEISGRDPSTERLLQAALDLHAVDPTSFSDERQNDLQIYLGDPKAKRNVTKSLQALERDQATTTDTKLAAQALLEILGVD